MAASLAQESAMVGALWRVRAAQRESAREDESEWERQRVSPGISPATQGYSGTRPWMWGTEPCMAAMHRARVAVWSICPSTWREMVWARWELNWASYGPIWTLGPKAKL